MAGVAVVVVYEDVEGAYKSTTSGYPSVGCQQNTDMWVPHALSTLLLFECVSLIDDVLCYALVISLFPTAVLDPRYHIS